MKPAVKGIAVTLKHGTQHWRTLAAAICGTSLALYAQLVSATTIVVVRTPNGSAIAADTEATMVSETGQVTLEPVCKIYRINKFFFAVGGLARDPNSGFDSSQIIARALGNARDTADALRAAGEGLKSVVPAEMLRIKESPQRGPPGGQLLNVAVLIVGVDHAIPTFAAIQFTASQASPTQVLSPPARPEGGIWWSAPNQSVVPQLAQNILAQNILTDLSPADAARSLVQADVDAHIPGVGAPITVVGLSKNGVALIDSTLGNCPTPVKF